MAKQNRLKINLKLIGVISVILLFVSLMQPFEIKGAEQEGQVSTEEGIKEEEGKVVVNYLELNRDEPIEETYTASGVVGSHYDINEQIRLIPGYELVEVRGAESGKITKNDQVINVYYQSVLNGRGISTRASGSHLSTAPADWNVQLIEEGKVIESEYAFTPQILKKSYFIGSSGLTYNAHTQNNIIFENEKNMTLVNVGFYNDRSVDLVYTFDQARSGQITKKIGEAIPQGSISIQVGPGTGAIPLSIHFRDSLTKEKMTDIKGVFNVGMVARWGSAGWMEITVKKPPIESMYTSQESLVGWDDTLSSYYSFKPTPQNIPVATPAKQITVPLIFDMAKSSTHSLDFLMNGARSHQFAVRFIDNIDIKIMLDLPRKVGHVTEAEKGKIKYEIHQYIPDQTSPLASYRISDQLAKVLKVNVADIKVTDNVETDITKAFDIKIDDQNLLTLDLKVASISKVSRQNITVSIIGNLDESQNLIDYMERSENGSIYMAVPNKAIVTTDEGLATEQVLPSNEAISKVKWPISKPIIETDLKIQPAKITQGEKTLYQSMIKNTASAPSPWTEVTYQTSVFPKGITPDVKTLKINGLSVSEGISFDPVSRKLTLNIGDVSSETLIEYEVVTNDEAPVGSQNYSFEVKSKEAPVSQSPVKPLELIEKIKEGSVIVNFVDFSGKVLHEPVTLKRKIDTLIDLTEEATVAQIVTELELSYKVLERPEEEKKLLVLLGSQEVSYVFEGWLTLVSAPEFINFGTTVFNPRGTRIDNPEYVGADLIVQDGRSLDQEWTLNAKLEKPLAHTEDETLILENGIRYVTAKEELTLTEGSQPIFSQTNQDGKPYNVSRGWSPAGEGFKLEVEAGQLVSAGSYEGTIVWELVAGP